MNPSSLFQFIIGFFLGVILFGAGIAGGAYFFLTNVSGNTSKPTFAEEKPIPEKKPESKPSTNENPQPKTEAKKPETKPETEDLPAGAYKAKVTWSTGLSLRSNPSSDAQRVGGVDYNADLIILTTSNDNQWQKVRVPSSGQEGWVKSGNVEKVN
jgi:Bacterial SH3 domain